MSDITLLELLKLRKGVKDSLSKLRKASIQGNPSPAMRQLTRRRYAQLQHQLANLEQAIAVRRGGMLATGAPFDDTDVEQP